MMSERYNFSWLYIAARTVDDLDPMRPIHKNRPPAWMTWAPAMALWAISLATGNWDFSSRFAYRFPVTA